MNVICPHCEQYVIILEINCAIFRHAVLRENFQQINPHADKQTCDYLSSNKLIYGCGKPFKIVVENNKFIAIKCDYI